MELARPVLDRGQDGLVPFRYRAASCDPAWCRAHHIFDVRRLEFATALTVETGLIEQS